ncbi:MAG: hypothetical protein AAFO96_28170, partial [Bacteroidota bacterium]
MSDDDGSGLKEYHFRGEEAKYRSWSLRFVAFLKRKKCHQAVINNWGEDEDVKSDDDDKVIEITEKQREMNDKAVSYLLDAIKGNLFNQVSVHSSDNAYKMWQFILGKFEKTKPLQQENNLIKLEEELVQLKMTKKEQPEDLKNKLDLLNEKFTAIDPKYTKDESVLKAQFFVKLPSEYNTRKTIISELGLVNKSYEELVESMQEEWKTMESKKPKNSNDNDVAYNVEAKNHHQNNNNRNNNRGKKCRYCGKLNHVAKECNGRKRDEAKSKKLGKPVNDNRICYNCQQQGHLASECPEKKDNNNNRGHQNNTSGSAFNTMFEEDFVGNIQHHEQEVKSEEVQMIGDSNEAFNCFFDDFYDNDKNVTDKVDNLEQCPWLCYPCEVSEDSDSVTCESQQIPEEDFMLSDARESEEIPEEDFLLLKKGKETEKSEFYCNDEKACETVFSFPVSKCEAQEISNFNLLPHNSDKRLFPSKTSLNKENHPVKKKAPCNPQKEDVNTIHHVFTNEDDTDLWLIDSGATINIVPESDRLTNIRRCNTTINVGTGWKTHSRRQGDLRLIDDGTGIELTMMFKVVPGFHKKIISTQSLQSIGWDFMITQPTAILRLREDPSQQIKLHQLSDGMYYLKARGNEAVNAVSEAPQKLPNKEVQSPKSIKNAIDVNDAHNRWGHKGLSLLKKTAKYLGVQLVGQLHSCEGCGMAMARRKAISKTTLLKAESFGERLFVDTAGPYEPTLQGNKYIFAVVDDYSR